MSMLAGPRHKQKVINLRAKNDAWSNDSNKFGQRMLEKMGWSSGKGLGAKENGIVEHVVARYKNDEKGLGFEDKNDQWTKHEDDFDVLLSNLSNGKDSKDKLHSGVSLEDKSKKSRTRIHYHKFMKGKDLSRYSEKDLANIFGKKSFKNIEKEEKKVNDEALITEQVFTEKGSMEDYFRSKLASKSKRNMTLNSKDKSEEVEYNFKGFSGSEIINDKEEPSQNFGFQPFSFYNKKQNNSNEQEGDRLEPQTTKKSKHKESTQSDEVGTDKTHSTDCDVVVQELEQQENIRKNNPKPKKKRNYNEIESKTISYETDFTPVVKKKIIDEIEPISEFCKTNFVSISKKKKTKLNKIEPITDSCKTNSLPLTKKKKKKIIDEIESITESCEVSTTSPVARRKKIIDEVEPITASCDVNTVPVAKKKKIIDEVEPITASCDVNSVPVAKKKKKKKIIDEIEPITESCEVSSSPVARRKKIIDEIEPITTSCEVNSVPVAKKKKNKK